MPRYITLILTLLTSLLRSQEGKDYIIKLNKDTSFTKVIKLDVKLKNAICEEKGRKIKYQSKDILAVKFDTLLYESALVRLKKLKGKHFMFLQKTVKGNLCLYETSTKKTKFLLKIFGEDLIHLRWVYRAHDWIKKYAVTVYFYKMEYEPREKFSKYYKEKTTNCKLLQDKLNSKENLWTPTPRELVQFYNTNCK